MSCDAPRPSRRGRLHSRSLDASAALLGALSRGLHSRRPPPTPQPQEMQGPRGRRAHLRARKPMVLHYASDAATATASATASATATPDDSGSEDDSTARPRRDTVTKGPRHSHRDATTSAGRRAARAERQSAKYGVAWRADHESTCCQLCFALFTTLSRRRHHCRLCGALVCGSCSQDQALVAGRFSAPRRACDACCGLLRAMAAVGDPRVRLDEGEGAATAAATPAAPTAAATPRLAATPTNPAAPTPRYRDRLAEVQRVMAAGHKSRRRGSAEKHMYVVPSEWLRSWLAFTASASRAEARTLDYDDGERLAASVGPQAAADGVASMGQAPGPIDTLPLLEMQSGRLVRRAGLVRDAQPQSMAAAPGPEQLAHVAAADFQLLSPEVWEVFQRLYGGGPAIRVSRATAAPEAWAVDMAGLLAAAQQCGAAQLSVAVERALLLRHRDPDASAAAAATSAASASASASAMTPSAAAAKTPRSPAWTASSSSGSSPLSLSATSDGHERLERQERGHSLPSPRATPALASASTPVAASGADADAAPGVQAAAGIRSTVTGLSSRELEPLLATTVTRGTVAGPAAAADLRATTTSASASRSPTAATAASAFAVAMKQARLNAQKALDDRASRIITA